MQRELKFRVWDKLEKRMITPDQGYQGHYVLTLDGKFHNLQNGSGGYDYIVLPYTGLKDKNGKEIYEGDIMKLHDCNRLKDVGDVYFGSGAYHVRGVDCLWFGSKHGKCDDYEIIGDIFENE